MAFTASGFPEKEMYFDSTLPFPYETTVASRVKPSSMPPVVTGAIVSFFLPLLTDLHHVQRITRWQISHTLAGQVYLVQRCAVLFDASRVFCTQFATYLLFDPDIRAV